MSIDPACLVQLLHKRKILRSGHEQFDGDKIVWIECEGIRTCGNADQTISPAGRQRFENGVPEDIGMISVAPEVGAVFAKRFLKHVTGEFIEGLGAEIRIVGGGEW